jgi:hypothetical protein
LDLVSLKEVENYISILLNESKDLAKEGLYRLFKDCCDNLQRLKGNMDFEKLFKRIKETFEKSYEKSRLRFMLFDLLDMKKVCKFVIASVDKLRLILIMFNQIN